MYHKVCVSQYCSIFSCYRQPKWLRFSPIHVIIWDRFLIIRILLNSRAICRIRLQIYVLQYWFMMNVLRVADNLDLIILDLSIIFLRILLTTYFAFMLFRSTRRWSSLSRNFMYVIFILYNHRSSSLMITFASKRNTLCQFRSLSTRLWNHLTSRAVTFKVVVDMDEGHLPVNVF